MDLSAYDAASWANKQAHMNGQRAELAWLEKMLEIIP